MQEKTFSAYETGWPRKIYLSCLLDLAVLPLNSCLPCGGLYVCRVHCLPPGQLRQILPFVILLTLGFPSCYPSSLDQFVHVNLGVTRGTYNIGWRNELSGIIFPLWGSQWHTLLSQLCPACQAFCQASHSSNLHGVQLHLPFGKSISPSSGKSLNLKIHYHSPHSTPNSIFIQVWVIKLTRSWAGWLRAGSREMIASSKSPDRVPVRAESRCIFSLSVESCCPRAEKLQKPTWVSGALCLHAPWTGPSHVSLHCDDHLSLCSYMLGSVQCIISPAPPITLHLR